jgi:hypothetical protein
VTAVTARDADRCGSAIFRCCEASRGILRCIPMKQLPDILTSAAFWASVGTVWAAAGAWFTYVAAALDSRRKTYDGICNVIEGLEAELSLVSDWASGEEGSAGYVEATRAQLVQAHPDWFNPSRTVFTFSTPNLTSLTSSPYTKPMRGIMRPFVLLNHSIHRLFDYIGQYQAFVMGDVTLYQVVLEKFAPQTSPLHLAASVPPQKIVIPPPCKIQWDPKERVYINHIFMMNEAIHQRLIGGADSKDELCLYKSFRSARGALETFKKSLRWTGSGRFSGGTTSGHELGTREAQHVFAEAKTPRTNS